jgi:uncharacterized protein (DUF2237 family)
MKRTCYKGRNAQPKRLIGMAVTWCSSSLPVTMLLARGLCQAGDSDFEVIIGGSTLS